MVLSMTMTEQVIRELIVKLRKVSRPKEEALASGSLLKHADAMWHVEAFVFPISFGG